jgi:hypothetical protein
MAFTDPQSIDIGAGAVSLPRTSVGQDNSVYTSADGLLQLKASSTYGKRNRRTLRIDVTKVTSDPFIPAQNVKVSMSYYVVIDAPPVGFTATEQLNIYKGLKALQLASSDALMSKLLGGES